MYYEIEPIQMYKGRSKENYSEYVQVWRVRIFGKDGLFSDYYRNTLKAAEKFAQGEVQAEPEKN